MSNRYSCIEYSDVLDEFRVVWSWCLPAEFEILLISAFGDVFYECEGEGIFWLNTRTAEIERVATDRTEFQLRLKGEEGIEWLLPRLIDELENEGKHRESEQCYTCAILPIFADGKFEPWNFKAVPASQHFGLTAHIHRQIAGLPDGMYVKTSVEP